MAERELKKLDRAELIEIIYELQKREKEYLAKIDNLEATLNDKTIKISEAGSIAEAALKLNGIFESAQAAADQFLDSIHAANRDEEEKLAQTEAKCKAMINEAEKEAERIVSEAERSRVETVRQTELMLSKRWQIFQAKVDEIIENYSELSGLLNRNETQGKP